VRIRVGDARKRSLHEATPDFGSVDSIAGLQNPSDKIVSIHKISSSIKK
jgi:hypothetical protein